MGLEDAAVQVGHVAQQRAHFGRTLRRGQRKALEEERAEKIRVEVIHAPRLARRQFVKQIVRIILEKAFFLDEVDEHQPVEHRRDVPALHRFIRDAVKELGKGIALFLEAVVELLGGALHVEGSAQPPGHIHQSQPFLFFQAEGDGLKLLQQRVPGLLRRVVVLTRGEWLPRLAAHPLPDL